MNVQYIQYIGTYNYFGKELIFLIYQHRKGNAENAAQVTCLCNNMIFKCCTSGVNWGNLDSGKPCSSLFLSEARVEKLQYFKVPPMRK